MTTLFHCKECKQDVVVNVIQRYAMKTWYSIDEDWQFGHTRTKVKNYKRYGKVIVPPHPHHSGISGLFKTKQCPNSNTQVKMIVEQGVEALNELD
jgi:hypothetical protein